MFGKNNNSEGIGFVYLILNTIRLWLVQDSLTFELMREQLIIFDCDGVLVDSERLSAQAFCEVVAQVGVEISTEEAFEKFKGGSLAESIDYIESRIGRKPDMDIAKAYREHSFKLFKSGMKPIAGVDDVLVHLPYQKCVGSNGPNNKILLNLETAGLMRHFKKEHVFSAYDDDIRAWKPDPKLFLTAAEKMGFEPKDCTVIEDSKHGAEAAQRAGMRCFGYTQDTDPKDFTAFGATPFGDMKDLLRLLVGE